LKDGIKIQITGDKVALARLKRAKGKLKQRKKLFQRIAIYLEQSTGKTFKMEGRPVGWKPSQRAETEGGKTLQDTRQLFGSVTGKGVGAIRDVSDVKLVFGTSLIHAPVHQFGNPDRGLPARPFLGIHKEDEKEIKKIQKQWAEEIVRR